MMENALDLRAALMGHLKELQLPTMRASFEDVAGQARKESLSHERYLLELALREVDARRAKRTERLLRESRLPLEKSLAALDRKRLAGKVNQQLATLVEGSFLDRRENVLAFGNPGAGKTHLLCALAQELIVKRGRPMFFTTCALLVQDLLIAKRDLKLARMIKRLSRFDGLLIDDIGYVHQGREEMDVLFTLLAERYERGSVLLTSNLPFSQWESIFKDAMTTAAAIDRLVHHSVILELNLPSYRVEHARKTKKITVPADSKSDHGTSRDV
jgi:DNA replication protein DnaC